MNNQLKRGDRVEMGPAGIMVVGPSGRFMVQHLPDGRIEMRVEGCYFAAPAPGMSDAHKDIVSEAWGLMGAPTMHPAEDFRNEIKLAKSMKLADLDNPQLYLGECPWCGNPGKVTSQGCKRGQAQWQCDDCGARGPKQKTERGGPLPSAMAAEVFWSVIDGQKAVKPRRD